MTVKEGTYIYKNKERQLSHLVGVKNIGHNTHFALIPSSSCIVSFAPSIVLRVLPWANVARSGTTG